MTLEEQKPEMARPDSGQCLLDCHEDNGGGGGRDLEGTDKMDTLGL